MTYKELVRNFVQGIKNRFYSELKGDTFGVTEEALMPYGYPNTKEPLHNSSFTINDDVKVVYRMCESVSRFDDLIEMRLILMYRLQKTMYYPVFKASYFVDEGNQLAPVHETFHYDVYKNTSTAVDRRAQQVNRERAKEKIGKDLEGLFDL